MKVINQKIVILLGLCLLCVGKMVAMDAQPKPSSMAENRDKPPAARSQIPQKFLEPLKTAILESHTQQSPDDIAVTQPIDIKTFTPAINFNGHIVPALQQRTVSGHLTLDCGYFALYNALSFSNPRGFPQLNRQRLIMFLRQALDAMDSYPELRTFDDLEERELRHIVNTLRLPIAIFTVQNLLFIAHHQQTFENALEEDENQESVSKRQLLDFLNRRTNNVVMVVFIANIGHWVAIKAERNNNEISLTIADSMTPCAQAKISNPETRQAISNLLESLVPYHVALSNNVAEWKNVLTEELFNPRRKTFASSAPCQACEEDGDHPVQEVSIEAILKERKNQAAKADQQRQLLPPPAAPSTPNAREQIPNEGHDRVSISPELAAVCLANFPQGQEICSEIEKHLDPVRVLFSGPPNIGKTTLARAIARSLNLPRAFYDCTAGDKFVKSHEEGWDNVIQPLLNAGKPYVIIIDEIDQLKPVNNGENPALHIKQAIADCSGKPQISFIATTNKPDEIDAILKLRFGDDMHFKLTPPNLQAQVNILKYCFAHVAPQIANVCSDDDLRWALGYLDAQTVEDVLRVARTTKRQIQTPDQRITREMVKSACLAVKPAPHAVTRLFNKVWGGTCSIAEKSYKPIMRTAQVARALEDISRATGFNYKKRWLSWVPDVKIELDRQAMSDKLTADSSKIAEDQLAQIEKRRKEEAEKAKKDEEYKNSSIFYRGAVQTWEGTKLTAYYGWRCICVVGGAGATVYAILPEATKKKVADAAIKIILRK